MLLDSARGLKHALTETVLARFVATNLRVKSLAVPAGPVAGVSRVQPSIALGITRKAGNDFQIAVRCQRSELMVGKEIEQIRRKARNEVDVRFIGPVGKRATQWTQLRHRPLLIGTSTGHAKVTAGTIGAFVRMRGSVDPLILSNNHVLANENRAKIGDAILQPGAFDGGAEPVDRVATLAGMIRLRKFEPNAVDAAAGKIDDRTGFDPRTIRGFGKLAGLGPAFLEDGTEVAKLGRTTGLTHGRVTAFELDNLVVSFDIGPLRFNGQIEIEGADDKPFSRDGDSGSLIIEAGTRLAVALLFAGTEMGGENDQGLTYVNPLRSVLDTLKVDLLTE